MAESASEKTIAPTPHRRQQAREEGRVAHSQDLAAAVLLVVGLATVLTLGGRLLEFFARLAQRQWGGAAWMTADSEFAVEQGRTLVVELAGTVAPLMGLLVAAGLVVHVAQTGFLWLPQRIVPDFNRVSPVTGWRRMMSMANWMRLAMGLVKLAVVGIVAGCSLYARRDEIVGSAALSLPQLGAFISDIAVWTGLQIASALLGVAVLDYAYQWWRLQQELRMTPQELREEMKNQQGDGLLASRRRTTYRQWSNGSASKSDRVESLPAVRSRPT